MKAVFLSSKLALFTEQRSQKAVCLSEETMSTDKYLNIFLHQMEAKKSQYIVFDSRYYPSNIFHNTCNAQF